MTNNLETRTETAHKIKAWEGIVSVVGTAAYIIRCLGDPQISDIGYSNKVIVKGTLLITKDIFLTTGAAYLNILM